MPGQASTILLLLHMRLGRSGKAKLRLLAVDEAVAKAAGNIHKPA